MLITNISNQGVILRQTDHTGAVIDTLRIQPGASDVHEKWAAQIALHPLLVVGKSEEKIAGLVEPPPPEAPPVDPEAPSNPEPEAPPTDKAKRVRRDG